MSFSNGVKHFVLNHYLWVGGLLTVFLFVGVFLRPHWFPPWFSNLEKGERLMILGVPFTFVFFAQKQKLEETRLFNELFNQFNARYAKLNENLNRIASKPELDREDDEERDVLYDYFNLCAEEFLFFHSQGYIPKEVWTSWWKGMEIYFACPRIRKVWDEDPGKGSYYGFIPPAPDSAAEFLDRRNAA